MLPGAEGEAGVDLERDGAGRHRAAMGRGVDIEAVGAERLEPGLAHRHPIVFAERLQFRHTAAEAGQLVQICVSRRMIEISVDQPVVGPRRVRLVGDQHRRIGAGAERVVEVRHRFSLCAAAGDGDAPTHLLAASLASRASSAAAPRAA